MRKTILILFSVICIFSVILFVVFNFFVYPKKYKNYVTFYAAENNLDSALVYAVIKAESNFDKNATSKSGAMGLMQLMPTTAKWIAEELGDDYSEVNLYNPETNVRYGCFYLKYLFERFSDVDAVVCAYNAGESVVKNWLDDNDTISESKIDYPETKAYLKRVKGFYKVYKLHEICK